jgi:hypothetical protein
MADQLSLRGGTTTEHGSFTGANKEVTVDTTKKTLVVHDGATVGGHPIMRENGSNSALALGSAASPSLKFTGDPNTGLYSPGADQVAISTNGTGRLFVDASGNVGVGTSTPQGLLDVYGTGNTTVRISGSSGGGGDVSQIDFFRIGSNVTSSIKAIRSGNNESGALTFLTASSGTNTERMRLDSSGRLGLGTSTPSARLNIVGSFSQQLILQDVTTNSSNKGGTFNSAHYTNTEEPVLVSAGFSTSTDNICSYGGGWSSGNAATTLIFYTAANNTTVSGTERLRIDSSGRVGIGTTSPNESLEVAGNIHVSGADRSIFNRSNNALTFGTNNAERARIDSSGRLLVGTSTASSNFFNVTITSNVFQIERAGADESAGISITSRNTGTGIPFIVLARSNATTAGANTLVTSGQNCGQISFQGNDGTEFVEAASIRAFVDGTPGANDMPGRLVFSVTLDGASSPTEAFRITNDRVRACNQAAPAAVNATATLTVANLKTGIITSTSAAATDMTLPTGTDTEEGFSGIYTNMTFEWSVINTGPSLVTVLANTAHTLVGSGAVATGTSARFASRRSAANTFVTYRLS